ncbi:hypothetical protein SAMN05444365_105208 [Micromonospora pattaloongensis]|uniref:Clumping factor A n=1 Tax=Micromonospora pattaloongensis TaxID=405436 RepID=A0A1H3Q3Y3_9ACTN|nr:hypothetical protein [Micromonospora pattaloongensis]SDZ07818.1 hypothetical protein SAMN05444365_105208 [Micromonospora pattaloongensis]
MIVASLLLILVAVTLLVLGLASGSSALLISSIAASLFAAVALVVGARQAAAGRAGPAPGDDEPDLRAGDEDDTDRRHRAARIGEPGARPTATAFGAAPPGFADPVEPRSGQAGASDVLVDAEPADEPPPQQVSPVDAARVARLLTEVLVVDARPRYHLAGCAHLRDRESEPLPVREAVELGFTPCGRCEPDHALLSDARRG